MECGLNWLPYNIGKILLQSPQVRPNLYQELKISPMYASPFTAIPWGAVCIHNCIKIHPLCITDADDLICMLITLLVTINHWVISIILPLPWWVRVNHFLDLLFIHHLSHADHMWHIVLRVSVISSIYICWVPTPKQNSNPTCSAYFTWSFQDSIESPPQCSELCRHKMSTIN